MSISAVSQIGGEHCVTRAQADSVNAALRTAASRHVTVVAASGDVGAVAEPCDVYAALAGWQAETAFGLADGTAGSPFQASGGGFSRLFPRPGYHQAFHDITTGNNSAESPPKTITGYQAAPGWDPVTGWGSPDAQVLVPLLAGTPPHNQ